MNPYPQFLIALERWASRRKGRRARELQHFLATLRLNSVIGGLLQSIYSQAQAGGFNVQPARTPDVTDDEYYVNRLKMQVAHSVGALGAIQLFVYNELQQRGLLHLIGGERWDAEEHGRRSLEATRRPAYEISHLRAGDPWTKSRPGERRPIRVLVIAPASAPSVSSTEPRDADLVIDSQGVVRKDSHGLWEVGSTANLGAVIALLAGEWHVDVKRLG